MHEGNTHLSCRKEREGLSTFSAFITIIIVQLEKQIGIDYCSNSVLRITVRDICDYYYYCCCCCCCVVVYHSLFLLDVHYFHKEGNNTIQGLKEGYPIRECDSGRHTPHTLCCMNLINIGHH